MKIEVYLFGRIEEEPACRRSPDFIAAIRQNKYDPCFASHSIISVLADVMKYYAAARNADKTRLRIKEVIKRAQICGEFQWLIERILTCDYMHAWFYAVDHGDHCYCLKTYSTDDTCTLFTLDTETLYAAKCVCESVMNEAKKPNND